MHENIISELDTTLAKIEAARDRMTSEPGWDQGLHALITDALNHARESRTRSLAPSFFDYSVALMTMRANERGLNTQDATVKSWILDNADALASRISERVAAFLADEMTPAPTADQPPSPTPPTPA